MKVFKYKWGQHFGNEIPARNEAMDGVHQRSLRSKRRANY